jgi:ComF family protein
MLVIPVPLHPRRLRERGFNQSLLLARHVARALGAELDFMSLRRERYTLPQTGLTREARRKNVRRAFRVIAKAPVRKREVLLIDDVATTGNTLDECARVLRKAGCDRVVCLVLARAADPRTFLRPVSNANVQASGPSNGAF